MKLNVFGLKNSAILYLYAQRSSILINPEYQRMGEVWNLDKKQLLIDSILNDFDIPKIYFHDLRDYNKRSKNEYAIIDGRQRLEAIWDFIDGKCCLADDFSYLKNPKINLCRLAYGELSERSPHIKQLFDATSLSVFVVQTDDLDLIEDMFSRLNEAVPLNAAEKRNAFGGPLPKIVRRIANTGLFKKNLKISNKRYQHRDLAAKLLYLAHSKKIVDTKKVYLDLFFRENKSATEAKFKRAVSHVQKIISDMASIFTDTDKLLNSSGMVVLYFLLFDKANKEGWRKKLSRSALQNFETSRADNRAEAEEDLGAADYQLLEFDRLNQTPNDAFALKYRLDIMERFIRAL
jgi:hypothetical protein